MVLLLLPATMQQRGPSLSHPPRRPQHLTLQHLQRTDSNITAQSHISTVVTMEVPRRIHHTALQLCVLYVSNDGYHLPPAIQIALPIFDTASEGCATRQSPQSLFNIKLNYSLLLRSLLHHPYPFYPFKFEESSNGNFKDTLV